MTIGQRIKKIRLFRGMTQKELGNILGFGAHGDIRIAQYESGVRTPKEQMLIKMADVFLCTACRFFFQRSAFLKMISCSLSFGWKNRKVVVTYMTV